MSEKMTRAMEQDGSEKRMIAERVSILDLVSPHVHLKKAGRYYKGLCPFHPDKNPSFVVNPDRNTFYCFGCGVGGDIYSFLMKFHNLPFLQAMEELARRAGVQLRERARRRDSEREEAYRRGLALNESVRQFYHRNLLESPEAERARRYLSRRGVGGETVGAFSLGYAPGEWDGLQRFLRQKPGALELAAALGLLIPRKDGEGSYDRFRNRLMFPIFNATGKVLGFGGRSLGEQEPKYMNSPESFLYHKGSILYGLQEAQASIRSRDAVIVVEGYFDLLALHQHGVPNSVAVLGTALTTEQIDILKRHSPNLVLVFDGDLPGRKASFRNLPELLERDIPARVVYLPEDEDPDSFLKKWGREAFEKLLEEAPPLLDLFLKERMQDLRKGDPVARKVSVLRQLLPLIRKIPDRLAQSFRIKSLAEEVGIPELLLWEELSNYKEPSREGNRTRAGETTVQDAGEWPAEEKLICQILIQFPSLLRKFAEAELFGSFKSASLGALVRRLSEHYDARGTLDLSEVLPDETKDTKLFRLLASLSCREEFTEEQAATALEDSIRRLKKRALKERLEGLNKRIQEAEASQQTDLQSQLSLEMQRLLEEKKALLC
jgi:DNA primase